jgi:hypothetical protein
VKHPGATTVLPLTVAGHRVSLRSCEGIGRKARNVSRKGARSQRPLSKHSSSSWRVSAPAVAAATGLKETLVPQARDEALLWGRVQQIDALQSRGPRDCSVECSGFARRLASGQRRCLAILFRAGRVAFGCRRWAFNLSCILTLARTILGLANAHSGRKPTFLLGE